MKNLPINMKKAFLILTCMLIVLATDAQTIHWIIFADTQDPNNGSEVRNSMNVYATQFIDRMNDAIIAKGYLPRQKTYSGSDFTEAKCKNVIKNLSCGKDDIVVFYYLGHGGRAQMGKDEMASYNQKYPWPDLAFNKANTNESINGLTLNAIHNSLKQKGARLTVTIGMCCNAHSSQYKKHGMSTQSRRYKIVSKKFAKKVGQQLFLKSKGDVLVASAQPGQFSYGGSYGGQEVDCFTAALCETTDSYANNDRGENVTWSSFLNEVSSKCTALARIEGQKFGEDWVQRPKKQVNVTLTR